MPMIRIYKARQLKDSSFTVNSKGTVYDRTKSGILKVGQMTPKGIMVSAKYYAKHAERLDQLKEALTT